MPDAQAGGAVQRQKRFAQIHHHIGRNDAVDRHGEHGFPACGHAFDAVGHRVHVVQQTACFAQQFLARGGGAGLARTAVKQQHIEGVFELAHPVGQGAGHQAELTRCGRKTALLRNGLQHEQGIGCEPIFGALHDGCILFQII